MFSVAAKLMTLRPVPLANPVNVSHDSVEVAVHPQVPLPTFNVKPLLVADEVSRKPENVAPEVFAKLNVQPATPNGKLFEVPPPSVGFTTVICNVPVEAKSPEVSAASSCVLLRNVVVRSLPLILTRELALKLLP